MNKGHWNPVDAVGNVESLGFKNISVAFDIGNVNERWRKTPNERDGELNAKFDQLHQVGWNPSGQRGRYLVLTRETGTDQC